MFEAVETVWQNKPMLEIIKDRKLVIRFGLTKAKAILACYETIKDFVAKYGKEP